MFANRWKPFIIYECHKHGICSFSDLKNAIEGISDTALNMQLKSMMEDNLVEKTLEGYKLTTKGIDLFPVLSSVYEFAIRNGYTGEKGNCAISYTKELIGSKWTSRILWILHNQSPTRFNELQKSIEGISHKVLKEKLNWLQQIGFVIREDHGTKSPWVDY
ncbi:MAG: helix-turn-helix domain-containing protein [bacterium]|nr:helix-turn-helix domain-containing protein [bacterium]